MYALMIDQPIRQCDHSTDGGDCQTTATWILRGIPGCPSVCDVHYKICKGFHPSWVAGAERLVTTQDIQAILLYVEHHPKPTEFS